MERYPHVAAKVSIRKLWWIIFPAGSILLIGFVGILSFLVYKTSHPGAVPESVAPSLYFLPSLEITIPSKGSDGLPGWWIPGLKDAPGIILAPGYGMNRSDALSLATALHESGFNILIFNQRGNGATPKGACTLGLNEAEDMTAAIRLLRDRPESDPKRMGIWGVDIGAHAALKAAADFIGVRAIAVDSAYAAISDFLDYRIEEDFGLENQFIKFSGYQIFKLTNILSSLSAKTSFQLQALSDRKILFIKGENRKSLMASTTALYDKILPRKEMISLKTARIHSMSGDDLRNYDMQVASFFQLNLR
jgi:pimeloyl-ACP methyl ester carboxylesterase